ncbi:uncharacterized protein LOC117669264 isoform X2 [Pantherophis guttatus]|uniref:Uncharacterized protein LOC117669264 isoform X2 n=1 Tax=Pantherophis guttatus TaxID=94885 RepID=A0ABM3ZNJ9_PANGU|nr:uncharacterized protein LOC117669264 isoform X2 [Pantherophis guttatus]
MYLLLVFALTFTLSAQQGGMLGLGGGGGGGMMSNLLGGMMGGGGGGANPGGMLVSSFWFILCYSEYSSILFLLNLSSAFNTINHSILLGQLQDSGLSTIALVWLLSPSLVLIGVDRELVAQPTTIALWHATGLSTLSTSFEQLMKLLGETIHHHGLRYHQYVIMFLPRGSKALFWYLSSSQAGKWAAYPRFPSLKWVSYIVSKPKSIPFV